MKRFGLNEVAAERLADHYNAVKSGRADLIVATHQALMMALDACAEHDTKGGSGVYRQP